VYYISCVHLLVNATDSVTSFFFVHLTDILTVACLVYYFKSKRFLLRTKELGEESYAVDPFAELDPRQRKYCSSNLFVISVTSNSF